MNTRAIGSWRLVDQYVRERRPRFDGDAILAERLQADMVGSSVEVRVDDLGDLFGAAVRDDRVDQPVGAAIDEIGLTEAEVEQALRVVAQAEVEPRVIAG